LKWDPRIRSEGSTDEAEVEGHMHVGGKRLNEEAKEPEDRDDDTPDVEGHMHVGGKR
jgi:hypothetical protein